MSELPATELLPLPPAGRRFAAEWTVRLGDVDPAGELRLDAVARYLQDVASDDATDVGLANAFGWIVRRTLIRVDQPGRLDEEVRLTTYCTGAGRSWAERRTSIVGEHGARVDAVSLWVQIDPERGRPARLDNEFFVHYGEAAAGRQVSSKLSLPARPPDHADRLAWSFRCTDLDPFAHVNNAAHWAAVEEVLQRQAVSRIGTAELEFVAPAEADDPGELIIDLHHPVQEISMWVVAHGRTLTCGRWTPVG